MRTLPIAAALLLAAVLLLAAAGSVQAQERTITCDGPYRGERIGYCHLMDHVLMEGVPEPVGLEKITKAGCEMYERCIIRARVTDAGKVDGKYQNWTVLRIYWARQR